MKKKLLLATSVLHVSAICVIVFLQFQPQLVTGKRSELQKILIIDYGPGEFDTGSSTTEICDKQKMNKLYDEMRNAKPIIANRMETEFSMSVPHYELVFCYTDREETVKVYFSETGRYLGKPDWYTVTRSTRIIRCIRSVLES